MILNMSGGGVDTSGVTATANDVKQGKVFVNANGEEVSGNIPTVTQATPSISVSSAGLITASATQTAGYVEAGSKSATKQLTVQAAKTVTPSASSQTAVASGRYTTGAVTVAAIPSTYAQLNYSVVGGTSQPTGATNKIWVNTSTSITSHVFSATQPTGASGMVWFQIGTSCSAPIDVLGNSNVATVYPLACKQYVSNAWVTKTAKTYQNSKWVDWTYIIINGTTLNSQLTLTSWFNNGTAGEYAKMESGGLHLYVPKVSETYSRAYLTPAIDVTNFTKLTVVWKGHGHSNSVGLVTQIDKTAAPQSYAAKAGFENQTNTYSEVITSVIDISSLNGDYYFCTDTAGSGYSQYTGECLITSAYLS